MEARHLGEMISQSIQQFASHPALKFKNSANSWETLSYKVFGKKITALASALIRSGIKKGDRVGIYSPNCYQWAMTDFACILAGAVSVPIYATNTADQARFIIEDAGIKLIFTGDDFQYNNVASFTDQITGLKIIAYSPPENTALSDVTLFESFISPEPAEDEIQTIRQYLDKITPEDVSTIIYTSGTTGNPKGVMLSHGNFCYQLACVEANFTVTPDDTSLCFLPLSHVYERMWSYFVYFKGATHHYLEDPKQVIETLKEVKPTAMVSVPRLYEKIYATVKNALETSSTLKKILFNQALTAGHEHHMNLRQNKPVSLWLKLKHGVLDKLVLSKIREAVGGDKNFFSSGGAPLDKAIEEFFFSCGLLICQGYGLTETSPMISYNTPGAFKFGTVGKPVPGCKVRIAQTGEIQVKGPQVMKGYYNNPEKTKEEIEDGWFKTGDIGEIDADGFLKITDRLKDLIITSGGKNIAPQHIETLVGKDYFIEQIVTIGDQRQFISALIVPFFEGLEAWAEKKQIKYNSTKELIDHPEVKAFYRKRIDYHSRPLAKYETIKKFALIPEPFTVEGGQITPTLKPKRKNITEQYKDLIDSMYA